MSIRLRYRRAPAPSIPGRFAALLAVDIVAFGAPHRDEWAQWRLRHSMYSALQESFRRAALPWRSCHREDRGDGALVVFPSRCHPGPLLGLFPQHLAAVLAAENEGLGGPSRLRLRLALHAGNVYSDRYGVGGHAVNFLFRLLEADAYRSAITGASSDLSLLISAPLLDSTPPGGLRCTPLAIENKETRTTAWLAFPRGPGAALPSRENVPALRLVRAGGLLLPREPVPPYEATPPRGVRAGGFSPALESVLAWEAAPSYRSSLACGPGPRRRPAPARRSVPAREAEAGADLPVPVG
ncbi:hypothetical protein [Actinocorallia longicatena]|uniref:Guanylate cyclase domain-containing protein n=1 Tax=Actinocorallia longicatena TaxID=111803 RepID=A0ABP6Q3V3_9ACTN